MTGKTQVMVGIKETIRYPSGVTAEEKTHRFTFEIPDKYTETDDLAKQKATQMILNKMGRGHDLFVILEFWDKIHGRKRRVEYQYFAKNPTFKMPENFTELKHYNKSGKPKASAGEKFDKAMEKGMGGVKKAGAVVGKGLDWFFMEGEYAHLRKKTPAKKTTKKSTTGKKKTTTTRRKTTTRKTTSTRSRQYAPSKQYSRSRYDFYDPIEDYPEYFEDYGMMPLPRRRY